MAVLDLEKDVLGPGAAAREIGVSVERVRQLIKAGRLPAYRTPLGSLLLRQDVLDLAETRRRTQRNAG